MVCSVGNSSVISALGEVAKLTGDAPYLEQSKNGRQKEVEEGETARAPYAGEGDIGRRIAYRLQQNLPGERKSYTKIHKRTSCETAPPQKLKISTFLDIAYHILTGGPRSDRLLAMSFLMNPVSPVSARDRTIQKQG